MTDLASADKREMLNMRIDPKIKFLATVAARYNGETIAEFIERAVEKALTEEAMEQAEMNREATPGTEPKRKAKPKLWNERMWNEDEGTRFFNLATTYPEVLTGTQRMVWTAITSALAKEKKPTTLENFIKKYKNEAAK